MRSGIAVPSFGQPKSAQRTREYQKVSIVNNLVPY